MSSVEYTRQEGIFDPADYPTASVSFIGLGGIGSFAAIATAKLGISNMTLVDYDTVEPHNVPNQFLPVATDGHELKKVHAVGQLCANYSGTQPMLIDGKFASDGINTTNPRLWNPRGVVVSGLDSMTSRKQVWENGNIRYNPNVKLYMDARIAGQFMVIYCVDPTNPDEIKSYEQTLHTDGEAVPLPCTERGVIDVGFMVGAMIVRKLRQYYTTGETTQVTTFNHETLGATEGEYVL